MKIGIISDLHIDVNSNEQVSISDFEKIVGNEILKQKIDLLLIAGDVSNDHVLSHQFIENVKQLTNRTILFVPGNHDYWMKGQEDKDSNKVLDYFKVQEESIIEKPYIINNEWAVVGHSGWYDYTFAAKRFSIDQLSKRTYNGRVWQDKLNTDWKMDDPALSKKFASAVQADLEKVKDKKIILMTHMVTYKNFGVKMPHPMFDYFNAFIGSSDYDQLLEKYPIKYSIMGHVHYRKREKQNGITYICACVGNRNEWHTVDVTTEVKQALQIINI
ncbi:cyclic 3',5'-adenosine monophosphate phosphodiesterase [Paraliobacillus sp. PM-2]|uniref:metallophosphoesterase n=1 Tax=Paraliobacillus sp. PM-2 TaxID=1462524 RepID=UPI00061BA5A0|nr:metallophosphoesterase [Paraliobacillus sp. PM-2]CQR46812.1 cyclic 3',5'-adenosine monophosphate phosphodiesterase [Paraliobacillus sp. PM-2]